MVADELTLALAFLGRELARVAAGRRGVDVERQELRPQRLDLLLGGRTHIVGLDHRPQAARGRDGLQPGDACPEHEHLGRADGAGRRRQHGEEAPQSQRRHQGRAVARDRGLRGEDVHRLGAGDARHELQGEGRHAGVAQVGDALEVARRLHEAHDDLAGAQQVDLGGQRGLDLDDHVGSLPDAGRGVDDARAGLRVLVVGEVAADARSGLDR